MHVTCLSVVWVPDVTTPSTRDERERERERDREREKRLAAESRANCQTHFENFCNLMQGDAAAVTSGASNLWEEPKVRI